MSCSYAVWTFTTPFAKEGSLIIQWLPIFKLQETGGQVDMCFLVCSLVVTSRADVLAAWAIHPEKNLHLMYSCPCPFCFFSKTLALIAFFFFISSSLSLFFCSRKATTPAIPAVTRCPAMPLVCTVMKNGMTVEIGLSQSWTATIIFKALLPTAALTPPHMVQAMAAQSR